MKITDFLMANRDFIDNIDLSISNIPEDRILVARVYLKPGSKSRQKFCVAVALDRRFKTMSEAEDLLVHDMQKHLEEYF